MASRCSELTVELEHQAELGRKLAAAGLVGGANGGGGGGRRDDSSGALTNKTRFVAIMGCVDPDPVGLLWIQIRNTVLDPDPVYGLV